MSHQFFFSPHILDNLSVPAAGFDVVQDISEPRLRLYVTARGIKTFFTRKRVPPSPGLRGAGRGSGRDVRIIIGRYPDVSIDEARHAVSEKIAIAVKPAVKRSAKITFGRLFANYASKKIARAPASMKKLERSVARHWAFLIPRFVADITVSELNAVHENIAETAGRATANRMLEIMKSMFKFAAESGHIRENPAENLKKFAEKRRTRKLSAAEFSRLLSAIKKERSAAIRSAFLMLVFGFSPKSAVFSMRWRDLDFNSDTWNGRALSDPAVVLLRNIPQSSAFVFPSRKGHLTDPRASWHNLTAAAGLSGIQMNDIYKFLSRRLAWTADREHLRENMNNVLNNLG
ncbi:MAG: hypothetical protein FWF97_00045 [Alphaproteobacteria bacterium]|nr:hypothetical protein [Alphaproteobacteria bacterium]